MLAFLLCCCKNYHPHPRVLKGSPDREADYRCRLNVPKEFGSFSFTSFFFQYTYFTDNETGPRRQTYPGSHTQLSGGVGIQIHRISSKHSSFRQGGKKQMKMVRSPLPANGTDSRTGLRSRTDHGDAFINRYFAEGPLVGRTH